MTVINGVDTVTFATKVERLCDFLLDQMPKDGALEARIIHDLKADAANMQTDSGVFTFQGLDGYMRGVPG